MSALDTDLKWVRAHQRLLTRAIEWDANPSNNSFVLRGEDLQEQPNSGSRKLAPKKNASPQRSKPNTSSQAAKPLHDVSSSRSWA